MTNIFIFIFSFVWCNVFLQADNNNIKGISNTIKPLILNQTKSEDVFPKNIKIYFQYEDNNFTLDLFKNADSSLQHFQPNEKLYCLYQGYVNSDKTPSCTFSLCHGLHGTFEYKQGSYYIQPKLVMVNVDKVSIGIHQEHTITKDEDEVIQKGVGKDNFNINTTLQKQLTNTTGVKTNMMNRTKIRKKRTTYNHNSTKHSVKEIKFLELYLVNDKSVYLHFKKNITFIEDRCRLIANLIDKKYRPLRVRIVLVGIEIWTEKDLIDKGVLRDSHKMLLSFMKYRKLNINGKVKNDNAQLITRESLDGGKTAGKAPIATICNKAYSAGIGHDSTDHPARIANVLAHEIGHNLGLLHDKKSEEDCLCDDHEKSKCLMSSHLDSKVKTFSQCSKINFEKTLMKGHGHCLFDFPKRRYKPAICGNNVIEQDEECDCGHRENCERFGNCCDPFTCKLYSNATCASGGCCEQCKLKERSTPCRTKRGECDLQEYCTGESSECPADTFTQDTTSCDHGSGYCSSSVCITHNHQCEDWFGTQAKSASAHCYKEFNIQGFFAGHCGKTDYNSTQKYIKCNNADVYCGKLQCNLFDGKKPQYTMKNELKWKGLKMTVPCVSINLEEYRKHGNLSLAKDGTKCGTNKICHNSKCIPTTDYKHQLNIKHCPKNCSGNGICNSKNTCHCFSGWAPPFCDKPGVGGSVSSGPIIGEKPKKKKKKQKYILFTVAIVSITVILMIVLRTMGVRVFNKLSSKMKNDKQKINSEELQGLLLEK